MRQNRKIYTYALIAGLLSAACDKTEESYYPGPESDIMIDVVQKGAILLSADGTAKSIDVTSTVHWDATLEQTENLFTVTQSSDKGDGTVTVSGGTNYNEATKTAMLYVTARNIDRRIGVEVRQAGLQFSMEETGDKSFPEEGGSYPLNFKSTVEWEFTVRSGDVSWLEFVPGISGEGDWYDITGEIIVKPNYTEEERSVTLVLSPKNEDLKGDLGETLPQPFTITQAAGTRPINVSATAEVPTYHECEVSVGYDSTAPVTEVGVRLKTSDGADAGNFTAVSNDGSYPASGQMIVRLSDLLEGTRYVAEPYVRSMVGETVGNPVEFTTQADFFGASALISVEPVDGAEVNSLSSITVSNEKNLPMGFSYQTSLPVRILNVMGEEIRILGDPEFDGANAAWTFDPITEAGSFMLMIPDKYFTIGEQFNGSISKETKFTYIVNSSVAGDVVYDIAIESVTPENDSKIEKISVVTVTLSEVAFPLQHLNGFDVSCNKGALYKVTESGDQLLEEVEPFDNPASDWFHPTIYDFSFSAVTTDGSYKMVIPAGTFGDYAFIESDGKSGRCNPEIVLNYVINAGVYIVGTTKIYVK